jgi:DNA-binding NarL/FixJ family response regulator
MKLTTRQREVFDLVALGLSNEEIGERLYISPYTVRAHVFEICHKAGISTENGRRARLHLMRLALGLHLAADLPRYDPRTSVVVPRAVWEQLQRLVSLVSEAA